MNRRHPAPPSPFNRFTRPGLPDDRPAPYDRETYLADADDARQHAASIRALGVTTEQIAAFVIAIGNAVGTPQEQPLVELLRTLAPGHDLFAARLAAYVAMTTTDVERRVVTSGMIADHRAKAVRR